MKAIAERPWSVRAWSACESSPPKGRSRLCSPMRRTARGRKCAYQMRLIEEFGRHGVETLFVKAPQGDSAEDHLLVQFQGMIAEYERAQILERSRRGKRHRAHSGEISVLSGAPYGYCYRRNAAAGTDLAGTGADLR